jgi:hypothetical protein
MSAVKRLARVVVLRTLLATPLLLAGCLAAPQSPETPEAPSTPDRPDPPDVPFMATATEQAVVGTGDAPSSNFHYYMQGESAYTTVFGGGSVTAQCVDANDEYVAQCILDRIADLLGTPQKTAIILRPLHTANDFATMKTVLAAGVELNILFNPYRPDDGTCSKGANNPPVCGGSSPKYFYSSIAELASADRTGCDPTWGRAKGFACVFKALANANPGRVEWTIDDFFYSTTNDALAGGNHDGFFNRGRMRDICSNKGANLPVHATVYCHDAYAINQAESVNGIDTSSWHTDTSDRELQGLQQYVSAGTVSDPAPTCITGIHLALLPNDYAGDGLATMNSCLTYAGSQIAGLTSITQNVYVRRGGSVLGGLSTLGCSGFNDAVAIARKARPKSAEYLFFVQPSQSDTNCDSFGSFSPTPWGGSGGELYRWLRTLTVSGNKAHFFE